MTFCRLAWISAMCLTVVALQPAAAVLQPESTIAAELPAIRLVRADVETDMNFNSKALMPGRVGEALCIDRSLCQDGNTQTADLDLSAFVQPASLFASPTLLANAALLTLGLLWVMLTRRSLRVARGRRG